MCVPFSVHVHVCMCGLQLFCVPLLNKGQSVDSPLALKEEEEEKGRGRNEYFKVEVSHATANVIESIISNGNVYGRLLLIIELFAEHLLDIKINYANAMHFLRECLKAVEKPLPVLLELLSVNLLQTLPGACINTDIL